MDANESRSRIVLGLHNHQPVGNFDSVFEHALEASYRPFLRMLRRFPTVKVVLHTSGSLLEWLLDHAESYVGELREAIDAGQLEVLGGPLQEPILAAIPRRDRIGQIRAHSRLIKQTFGVDPLGMWVPERVWEHSFVGDVTAAGIRYTVLDDAHFRAAGLRDDQLTGSYLCEDEGRVLRVFPIHERLRYIIPFHPVDEVMDEVRRHHERNPGGVVVFADDGEKFGVWPKTYQSVYEEGWLESFFQALVDAEDWLETTTLSAIAESEPAQGLISLPDMTYREMTEWVLPTHLQKSLVDERSRRAEADANWDDLKDFVRGGTWRNFFAKYPEAASMAARMKEVSARVELARQQYPEASGVVEKATQALYRGQCNCPYWHGAFGGLYLAHLRQATYCNLIEADTYIQSIEHGGPDAHYVTAEVHDFDFDLRAEVKLSSQRVAAYIAPSLGGQLYEFDVRGCGTNLLATLARRPEPYHAALDSADQAVTTKEDGLAAHIIYDEQPLRGLTDRFLDADADFVGFRAGNGLLSETRSQVDTRVERGDTGVWCHMAYRVVLEGQSYGVEKSIGLLKDHPSDLVVNYTFSELSHECSLRFGVELYLAGLAPNADDRYLYGGNGERLGQINSILEMSGVDRVGAVDEWLGLDVAFDWDQSADLWVDPIETVSGSEAGIERTYQATRFLPHWVVTPDSDGRWSVTLTLSTDTAAAQARELASNDHRREPVTAS